ncbi:cytosolic iron-sulfur assembly component 2A-like [Watersipora subatra]|uniref:cytosolic iron-sulfur assembly component 2A-like n=1 Tax=Watersipora subatra TaxID=2589382 RepID=UPI00355C8E1B
MAKFKDFRPIDDKPEEEIALDIFDIIKDIRDPEKAATLEELNVLTEDSVSVKKLSDTYLQTTVTFTPTVPHCSLATQIGLCIREKLKRTLPYRAKINILIKQGTHSTEEEVNKQINDKERVAAALENASLLGLVNDCIEEK